MEANLLCFSVNYRFEEEVSVAGVGLPGGSNHPGLFFQWGKGGERELFFRYRKKAVVFLESLEGLKQYFSSCRRNDKTAGRKLSAYFACGFYPL
jgi:hypothetical protein